MNRRKIYKEYCTKNELATATKKIWENVNVSVVVWCVIRLGLRLGCAVLM